MTYEISISDDDQIRDMCVHNTSSSSPADFMQITFKNVYRTLFLIYAAIIILFWITE